MEVIQQDENYFCSIPKKLRVLVEYFPKSMHDIGKLSFDVLAYVLFQTLSGFKQIFQIFGRVNVCDSMIGISNEGVVKVWVNPHFASN